MNSVLTRSASCFAVSSAAWNSAALRSSCHAYTLAKLILLTSTLIRRDAASPRLMFGAKVCESKPTACDLKSIGLPSAFMSAMFRSVQQARGETTPACGRPRPANAVPPLSCDDLSRTRPLPFPRGCRQEFVDRSHAEGTRSSKNKYRYDVLTVPARDTLRLQMKHPSSSVCEGLRSTTE